ncbi:MAG: general secretion pathway protein GspK [Deltaproteobacteria bacterium]|nr:general secretion pathway protein GspK [Deltaproteobacteria bacterium]
MGRFLRNSRGMALILTILIISLIVSLTLQFNISMRSDLHAAVNLRDGVKLGYIARSGFNYALAVLSEDDSGVDSLHDTWADPKTFSENSAALFDDGRFEVKVSDHSGRIQINKLILDNGNYDSDQKGLLMRFLKSPEFGLEEEEVNDIVDAVKDWIDKDDDPTGLGGAENSYYQTLEKPYSCKNAPIEFLEELLLVKGITRELFYGTKEKPGVSNYLSPHGEGGVNINTAAPVVLRAFSDDIDDEMVKDMDKYRTAKENEEGLSDPKWYKKVLGMSHVTIANELLTTSSTHFEITSKGFKEAMARQVTGMVKRKEDKFDLLSWKIE